MKTKKVKSLFQNSDFNNSDGMLTTIWGPSLWHFLHTMSFNYPNNPNRVQKNAHKRLLLSLKHTLPCKYCRINLVKNYKCLPLNNKVFKNRYNFSKYIYNLHEHINKMLHKESGLTYEDVRERYEHFRARCTKQELNERLFRYNHNKTKKNKGKKDKKEKGCVDPLYGVKSKCVLRIVPQKSKCKTFKMNKECKKKRLSAKKIH